MTWPWKIRAHRFLLFYETREQNGFKTNTRENPRTPVLPHMPRQASGRKRQMLGHTEKKRCCSDSSDQSDKCREENPILWFRCRPIFDLIHVICQRKRHLFTPPEITVYQGVTYLDNYTGYFPTDDIEVQYRRFLVRYPQTHELWYSCSYTQLLVHSGLALKDWTVDFHGLPTNANPHQ